MRRLGLLVIIAASLSPRVIHAARSDDPPPASEARPERVEPLPQPAGTSPSGDPLDPHAGGSGESASDLAEPPAPPNPADIAALPAADCNSNGTADSIDLTPTLLPSPPSQFLTDANSSVQSDRRSNIRCDDFLLTSSTRIIALDIDGRGGGVSGDTFTVRFWSTYSITDADTDGVLDPGTFHPLAVEYSENVPTSRVTRTTVNGTVFRWNIRLATPVLLAGSPAGGGVTHFLEVFYTGPAASLWTWERITAPPIGSPVHATQHIPETWWNQTGTSEMNGLRFQLYTARSVDVNTNGIPDECEDCNNDGTPDSAQSGLPDCNTNGIKDTCEIRMGLATDCNTNGKPDVCEAGDCDTNGTNDLCEVAAAAKDCNTNGILDLCEIQGLSAPAFEQTAGNWPATGFVSDGSYSAGGALVRADDFQLAGPREIGGVSLFGFFLNGAAGNGTTDTFTLRFWTNNASNLPGAVEYTEDVPASRVSRSAYLGNFFPGVAWRYFLKFKLPAQLTAGRHWMEIYYTGPAAGDWLWSFLEPTSLSPIVLSTTASNEGWSPMTNQARLFMSGFVGATDCNTNNTIDACEFEGHDANRDGTLDACEDCNTNGTPDQAEPSYRDCNSNGRLDACDLLPGGISRDCNTNRTPDECETPDCNTNRTPDVCELAGHDCNTDRTLDVCGQDCNTNGSADACDLAAGGAAVDCNTNHTLDACDPDCDTNRTPDDCELAAGGADCNANGFVDACEVAGTIFIAADQSTGTPTGLGFFSDMRGNQVLCDDLTLAAARKITAIRVSGFFASPGAGLPTDDAFTLRFWSEAGGQPSGIVHAETVSGANLTRTGSYTHTLRLAVPMLLQPGTFWLEVIYMGLAPGAWAWSERSPRVGGFAQLSPAVSPETWSSVGRDSHWDFQVLFGAADADRNGIPDECFANPCLSCPGDVNGDGRVDGADVQSFVTELLVGHTASGHARCADMNGDGIVNLRDAANFAASLLRTGGPCSAGACPGCRGDVNNDGRIDGSDIQPFVASLLAASAGGLPSGCADLNIDGRVDAQDAAAFAALLLQTAGPCSVNACASCPGDLNGDGRIDGADVQPFVAVLLAASSGGPQSACADLNRDGKVDAQDAAAFVALLLQTAGPCTP